MPLNRDIADGDGHFNAEWADNEGGASTRQDSGLEFFDQADTDVPVLAMTASTEADLARQLQALGVRYVIKPLSARDLIDVVNASLAKGQTHDAAAHPHRR